MKKTWDKLFRRKSLADTELREDYPTNSDSDITDDERRQREWQHHLNRRATVAKAAVDDIENENNWEYESEYNVDFGSDSSIVGNEFKERRDSDGSKYYEDRKFEEYKERADRYGTSYDNEQSDRKENNRKNRMFTPEQERKRDRYNSFNKTNNHPESTGVTNRIKNFEKKVEKRRGSCLPPTKSKVDRKQKLRENNEHYATWNDNKIKRKVRKQTKRRHRAHDISPDISDEENKYMVKLTMEDLNSIIKKNINSAVKTIVSAAAKSGKKSPNESFSTETETIFSGSSSHSTEVPVGLLQKQIKAQIDKDMLRGIRKTSTSIPGQSSEPHQAFGYRLSADDGQPSHQIPSTIPTILEIPPSPYLATHQQSQQSPYLNSNITSSAIPPPPPLPPNMAAPQVTFNLPNPSASGITQPVFSIADQILSQQNRRQSLIPGMLNFNDCSDMLGNSINQAQIDQMTMNQDLGANPFNTVSALSPNVLSRLRNRRHTLATLGNDDILEGLNTNLSDKFEQINNALRLLDSSKQPNVKESNENNGPDKTTSAASEITTDPATPTQPPILSIAEQIAAIKNKKKKPLQPGQVKMSGCVRGMLILTNIVFLIAGAGILGLGVWMMMDPNIETYFDILNVNQDSQDFKLICYAMCAVGAIVVFIGFMGCCGALKSNKCMISVFIIIVGVVILAEAGLGAVVFLHQDSPSAIPILSSLFSKIEENLRATLKRSIVEKYNPDTLIGTTWDKVQITLECCGASGPDDYKMSAWKNDTTNDLTIPNTCCVLLDKNAQVPEPSNKLLCQVGTVGFYFEIGCFDMMVGWFKSNSTFIVAAALAVLAIQIFSFIFALVICRQSNDEAKKYKKYEKYRGMPGLQ